MHRSVILLICALAAGAGPALAQESIRPGNPNPITPAAKAAAKKAAARTKVKSHVIRHATSKYRLTKALPAVGKVPLPKPAPKKAVIARASSATVSVPLPPRQPRIASTQQAELAPVGVTGVPPAERWKIMAALLWSGDYAAAAKGEDPLVAAIKRYQKRHKDQVTGTLTPAQRAALIAADHHHQNEFGWSVVVDPATGIRIGLPTKLVPYAHDAARGTRWSSPLGAVQVETFRIKEPGLKLADVYRQEEHEPRTRRVMRGALHDNSFFISGMQGLKYFSVRAEMRDGEVRGFTMLYDQAMDGIVAPVMVAMASAFSPFPERSAPFATLARSVEYGTGLIVSGEGHIVTARRLAAGCEVIVVPGLGDADRVAVDKSDGLALLRVYGQHKLSAVTFAADVPKMTALTLIGIPDPREQNGHHKLIAIEGHLSGSAIELHAPVPVAGFSGAAALDAQGRVLGLMATRNAVVASNAPAAPPIWLVRASAIRSFLAAYHVPPVTTPAVEARDAVVRVICVRK